MEPNLNFPKPSSPTTCDQFNGINWVQVCQTLLESQENQRLTSNPLMGDNAAMKLALDEVHVPQVLEEWKNLEKPQFEREAFLQTIFKQGTGKSGGKRIALIGEPGVGKTTLLQAIALWILDQQLGLPIWISLADLQGRQLRNYLCQEWLEKAIPQLAEVKKKELIQQFEAGQVWLLLDGADEIDAGTSSPLQVVQSQLEGWVAQARVVLSCRMNVWEGFNPLEMFETYQLLDFDYPSQVQKFIGQCFRDTPEQGERLMAELDVPERGRLRDLVRNPLRLALLCGTWQDGEAKLPETRAGLYQQFVDAFYRWKQHRFPTTEAQREGLNAALGRLAKWALDADISQFRLANRLVRQELSDSNPVGSVFELALRLGWLVDMGVAVNGNNQRVYTFHQSTFQEYFAALAVGDWREFLHHVPENPAQGTYRVFEPQWREVILLWLGREDVEKEEKEAFIKALVKFEDGCHWENQPFHRGFYEYRAYFLAAVGLGEFTDCSIAGEIVRQVMRWGLGDVEAEGQQWVALIDVIEKGARETLFQIPVHWTVNSLIEVLGKSQDIWTLTKVANILVEIAPEDEKVIDVLIKFLQTTFSHNNYKSFLEKMIITKQQKSILALIQVMKVSTNIDICRYAAKSLKSIDLGNETHVNSIIVLLKNSKDELISRTLVDVLSKITKIHENQNAIVALVNCLNLSQNEETRRHTAEILGKSEIEKETAIEALVNILATSTDLRIKKKTAENLVEIPPGNKKAIVTLIQLLESVQDKAICSDLALSLGKLDPGNQQAISKLVWIKQNSSDRFTRDRAARNLDNISRNQETLSISDRPKSIDVFDDSNSNQVYKGYWIYGNDRNNRINNRYQQIEMAKHRLKSDPGDDTAIYTLVELLSFKYNERIQIEAAKVLADIDSCHQIAIDAFIKIAKEVLHDDDIRIEAATYIAKIGKGNLRAIEALINIVKKEEYEPNLICFINVLGDIALENQETIDTLICLLESFEDPEMQCCILGIIGRIRPGGIDVLIHLLKTSQDEYIRYAIVEVLGNPRIMEEKVIAALISVLEDSQTSHSKMMAAETLDNIVQRQQMSPAQMSLFVYYWQHYLSQTFEDLAFNISQNLYSILWHCAQELPYPTFQQAWQSTNGETRE
ncbi:MAG: NACHT domain-containing protein [Geitlerinemataceae cyanobacterium]